jgi:hypothetical protein
MRLSIQKGAREMRVRALGKPGKQECRVVRSDGVLLSSYRTKVWRRRWLNEENG